MIESIILGIIAAAAVMSAARFRKIAIRNKNAADGIQLGFLTLAKRIDDTIGLLHETDHKDAATLVTFEINDTNKFEATLDELSEKIATRSGS